MGSDMEVVDLLVDARGNVLQLGGELVGIVGGQTQFIGDIFGGLNIAANFVCYCSLLFGCTGYLCVAISEISPMAWVICSRA